MATLYSLSAAGGGDREIVSADVSRNKRAEKDLASLAGQPSAVSPRLMTVQEDERVRISREIHDELGQLLTAAKLELWPLRESGVPPESIARVQRVLALLDRMMESVQRIAYELRPPLLTELGLASAIDVEVAAFQKRTGIECELSIGSPEIELDPERSTALFRVVQEALTNVARHAHATRVEIRLRPSQSEVLLEVRDNGRGITPAQLEDPRSLGLVGMRERVHQFGGTVGIEGAAGRGTIVTVRIPAQNATAATHQRGAGRPRERLSDREFELFQSLAEGMSVRAIATGLGLSLSTAHTRRLRVLKKLGLKSNADLIQYAITRKFV